MFKKRSRGLKSNKKLTHHAFSYNVTSANPTLWFVRCLRVEICRSFDYAPLMSSRFVIWKVEQRSCIYYPIHATMFARMSGWSCEMFLKIIFRIVLSSEVQHCEIWHVCSMYSGVYTHTFVCNKSHYV